MNDANNNGQTRNWRTALTRFVLFMKRRIKLNRFLLVIDTKKGVTISAITVIIVDLIDLLWNLSMTFGPLTSTMTSLLLLETFLVICISSVLLYAIKSENKSDLRSILFTWLVVVAIDYVLRASMIFSSLIISEKASATAKTMKSIASFVMLVLVAHCWQCVFTYYDDNNGKIIECKLPVSRLFTMLELSPNNALARREATVKITPSDDKGRTHLSKRPIMMMKTQDTSPANLERGGAAPNMLRAPTEDATKSRWITKTLNLQVMRNKWLLRRSLTRLWLVRCNMSLPPAQDSVTKKSQQASPMIASAQTATRSGQHSGRYLAWQSLMRVLQHFVTLAEQERKIEVLYRQEQPLSLSIVRRHVRDSYKLQEASNQADHQDHKHSMGRRVNFVMADLFQYIVYDLWDEIGDPEAKNYFWIQRGPWLTWLATVTYLYIVLKGGPDYMRNRKPYNLKWAIRLYNLVLVIINTYLFIGSIFAFRYGLDFWGCKQALSFEKRTPMLHYGHLFFHTRYLEFFDTFFFVLRKKQSQISFLHVFHHGVVPTLMYIGLKFYPVPFNALLPTTNMFVHIIMYAYYGLATFGPGMQKYLWWKKYLTTMQISQFALLLIHCSQPLLFINRPECNFPPGLVVINTCIGMTFLMLFISFYQQTYGNQRQARLKAQQIKNGTAANGSFKGYRTDIGGTSSICYATEAVKNKDL